MDFKSNRALEEFIDELNRRSLTDPWCRECAADVSSRFSAYEDAEKELSPDQKEAIECYIAACEELEFSLVYVAYQMGREQERMRMAGGQ